MITPYIYVFQVNNAQCPGYPIVSTSWNDEDAAYNAAQTYVNQLNTWYHHTYPKDKDSIYAEPPMIDILHLDQNGFSFRNGVYAEDGDGHPLPVGLAGYYKILYNSDSWLDWIPLPGIITVVTE